MVEHKKDERRLPRTHFLVVDLLLRRKSDKRKKREVRGRIFVFSRANN